MSKTFSRKVLFVKGKAQSCHFDWKYVERKRRDVLDLSIRRVVDSGTPVGKIKFYNAVLESPVGYMTAWREGRKCEPSVMHDKKPMTRQAVYALFR